MRLNSIQYLRAVAALMVVIFHLGIQIQRMGYDGPWADFLSCGVDIFFVISGFIMWSTTAATPISPLEFMRRRLARIAPLYWTVNILFIIMMLALPNVFQSAKFDLAHIVSSLLFLPYPHPVLATLEPLVVPGWTLNYEMFFYVIFGISLFLPSRARVYAIGGALLAIALAGQIFHVENTYFKFYTSNIIVEFLLGVIVATAYMNKVLMPPRFLFGTIVCSLALAILLPMLLPQAPRLLSWGIPAAVTVFAIVSAEAQKPMARLYLPGLLGDASYSLYLTHGVMLSAVGQLWRRLAPEPSALSYGSFAITATLSAVALAVLCYRLIELPADRLLKRRRGEMQSVALAKDGDPVGELLPIGELQIAPRLGLEP